jgi:hypothetical protein
MRRFRLLSEVLEPLDLGDSAICSITALRDHAFQTDPLGGSQHLNSVVETIGETEPVVAGTHDKNRQQVLALNQRQRAHVPAVVELVQIWCGDEPESHDARRDPRRPRKRHAVTVGLPVDLSCGMSCCATG